MAVSLTGEFPFDLGEEPDVPAGRYDTVAIAAIGRVHDDFPWLETIPCQRQSDDYQIWGRSRRLGPGTPCHLRPLNAASGSDGFWIEEHGTSFGALDSGMFKACWKRLSCLEAIHDLFIVQFQQLLKDDQDLSWSKDFS
jgi:hypothetical protein